MTIRMPQPAATIKPDPGDRLLATRSYAISGFAAYQEHIEALAGPAKRIRLGEGGFSYRLLVADAGNAQVMRRAVQGGGGAAFPSSGDNYIFAVRNPTSGQIVHSGHAWAADQIVVIPPHNPYAVTISNESDIITVSFPRQAITEFSRLVHQQDIEDALGSKPKLLQLAGKNLQMITALCQTMNQLHSLPSMDIGHHALRTIEESLMQGVIEAYSRSLSPPPPLSYRARLARRAHDYLVANSTTPVSISELCQEMNAAERTLHLGFLELYGMSPIKYLRFLRLNGAREVLATEPQLSVTDVATSWGFFHFGRFSEQYRKAFGELPSETRRRSLARKWHPVRWPPPAG
jgi:AraC family ethanolamine operon transcriptional activator